jgi:flagellar basal body-associated protein FliL
MILQLVGLIVLVAVVAVGAYWLITNVNFKSVKKEDENE